LPFVSLLIVIQLLFHVRQDVFNLLAMFGGLVAFGVGVLEGGRAQNAP